MTTVASRDLRNHTGEVLRQVAGGTRVTITVNGEPVAEIRPVRALRPQFFGKAELAVDHLWTAAVAMANGMDVVTQDDDFDVIEAAGGRAVIRV